MIDGSFGYPGASDAFLQYSLTLKVEGASTGYVINFNEAAVKS